MDHQPLHFLNSLKAILAAPEMVDTDLASAKMHWAVANQLVAQMIAQETVLPKLKAESYGAFAKVVPELETAFAGNEVALGIVTKFAEKCAAADAGEFQAALALAGDIQRALLNDGKPRSNALCKQLLEIEAGYSQKRMEAFQRASAQEGEGHQQKAGGAKNAKEYDEALLVKFIADSFPEESGIRIAESKFVSGGFSKYTMAIKLAGQKKLPENIILRGDASGMFGGVSVVDEFRLLSILNQYGVCVPKQLALEQSGQVFGSPFLLMERASGGVIGHMFKLPGTNHALCRDIAAKLAQIHRVPLAALGDKIDGAKTSSRNKVLSWLDEANAAWKPLNLPSPIYETAFKWLRDNVAISDAAPRGLVHADFGLNNILIEGDKVSAVLDWEFAHIGNSAYDLGYFYYMAESLGSWDEFLGAYADAGGTVPDSKQLDYQILLAATRLNVMLCQTVAAYFASNGPGLALTAGIVGNFYDTAALRIAGMLDRVM